MSIGKIPEFDLSRDDWRLYVDRLEQYFVVNKIASELQVPTLITVMGAECYELLVNLCTPGKPSTKTFAELSSILEQHLQPKPSALAERYKFRHRKQKNGETIAEYAAVLKKMSKTCEFGQWLEESLRDQMVCGIMSETIRQRLFAEGMLDYGKAYSLALNMEAAEKDAAAVEGHGRESSAGISSTAECQTMTAWRGGGGGGARRGASRSGQRARAVPAATAPAPAFRARRVPCSACGGEHDVIACRFATYVCRVCNKKGHLRRVCPNVTGHYRVEAAIAGNGGYDREHEESDDDEVTIFDINRLALGQCHPLCITLSVSGKELKMEVDTGSAVSCISNKIYQKHFQYLELKTCDVMLRYYTGETVRPVGVVTPIVKYKGIEKSLNLYVIRDGKTTLLGRQWLAELKIQLPTLDYAEVNLIKYDNFNEAKFISRYCDVFAEGLGRYSGGSVRIHLREGARPVFMRARPLAYAHREPVERELDQLVRDGILTPVERSDWATPIVPVPKRDGNIRICADYKLTLNKMIEVDRYPLPRIEDLLSRLHGGERFSKIDLSQAYAQFELDESKKYTVINTHKGLYMYNRLVYGLSSSPGIFQKHLEQLFSGIPNVGVFLDDVIITGTDSQAHIQNLNRVFERLQSYGLRVKKEKCVFFAKSVNYLGHVISKDGVHTCPEKVQAIKNTPAPTNVSELRAFIGLVMYYGKFVRNVSTIMAPLYGLLKAGVKYNWDTECQAAFKEIKDKLSSGEVLAHYTLDLPVVLTADASGVGVGAVISHLTAEGERPIAYASRTLTAAERAYSQIDKEALAIVYGVKKFHQYLYARNFLLRTDHKALTYILGKKVGIPVMAASRLQRWAVLLSGYNYDIEYVATDRNCADALSRLPQPEQRRRPDRDEVSYVNFVENFLPVTNEEVKIATAKDTDLSRIYSYIQSGWPGSRPKDVLEQYYNKRHELYADRSCIMWGYRLVIPATVRQKVLKQLHSSHMGIVKTKSIARSYVWWPNIDADIEAMCKQCETCAAEAPAPSRAPPQPWQYHAQPWTRIHLDFLGPFKGKTFLVLIDSTSKWLELFEMARTNASTVIKTLRSTFARFGIPVEIVSDQGPPFASTEFRDFLTHNGIRQRFSPVYHPSSNGAAENAVRICKQAIKKAIRDSVDVDAALQTFLLAYRNTIHSTTGESPSMLLQKRSLRSRLDLLRSERSLADRVQQAQSRQVEYASGVQRTLAQGEPVWAREYGSRDKWVKGTVAQGEGSRRYVVSKDNGEQIFRHVDQLRRRSGLFNVPCPEGVGSGPVGDTANVEDGLDGSHRVEAGNADAVGEDREHENSPNDCVVSKPITPHSSPARSPKLVPTPAKRVRKPIVRFKVE